MVSAKQSATTPGRFEMPLSEERKGKIIAALEERGARQPCPRCGNMSFTLVDGYFNRAIQPSLKGMSLGGPSIPTVGLVCNRCGFLSEHALGILGLLSEEEG